MKLSALALTTSILAATAAHASNLAMICTDTEQVNKMFSSMDPAVLEKEMNAAEAAGITALDYMKSKGIDALELERVRDPGQKPNWEGKLAIKNEKGVLVEKKIAAKIADIRDILPMFYGIALYDETGKSLNAGEEENPCRDGAFCVYGDLKNPEELKGEGILAIGSINIPTWGIHEKGFECRFIKESH